MFTSRRIRSDEGNVARDLGIRAVTDAPYAFGETLEERRSRSDSSYAEHAAVLSSSERTTQILLIEGDVPIGSIGAFFEKDSDDAVFVCAMWVQPERRRRGGARALVEAALAWGRAHGARTFKAWVADDNESGCAFWRACGFAPTSTVQPLPSRPQVMETLYVRS